ncbi:MAG: hypothetical protein FWD93_03010 [Coriobacteriia bacterium]|nr:hypothetical protein [Coriobacteriia bacterium]
MIFSESGKHLKQVGLNLDDLSSEELHHRNMQDLAMVTKYGQFNASFSDIRTSNQNWIIIRQNELLSRQNNEIIRYSKLLAHQNEEIISLLQGNASD